jgi:hypothetical protein
LQDARVRRRVGAGLQLVPLEEELADVDHDRQQHDEGDDREPRQYENRSFPVLQSSLDLLHDLSVK